MPALDDSLLGKMLDEYRVERALGKGGMARVYLALDTRLQRYVALKVIAPDLRSDKEYSWRFEREAQSIARLDHPNIVHIFRFGGVDDLYYMAMQYVDGADVERIVEDYRRDGELMALTDVARIVQEIGAALDYAHSRNVIHRDIKPGNIMLDKSGRAALTDFGLALLADVGTRGEIFGSPLYIAPEQAVSSGNAVPQSDLYALGVVLFYMLTGDVPFAGDDPMDVALRHVSEAPPLPSALNSALSAEIDAVVMRCLKKEPRDRYQTGAELGAALNAAITAPPGFQPPASMGLRHSQLYVSARVQQAQNNSPPLPELETIPPPEPRQVARPATPVQTTRTLMRYSPQSAVPSMPGAPPVNALHRVRPSFWIAMAITLGVLLAVALCGLIVLTLLNRGAGGPIVAEAPGSPTPTLTFTPSSTPTATPAPTRTAVPTPTALVLFGTPLPQAALPTLAPPNLPLQGIDAAPPGSRRLGEFAVEWYCNERGLGVTLFNNEVDWACTNADNSINFILQLADFDQICRTWYSNPNAFAVRDQQNQTQAYNWSCYEYAAQNLISLATPSILSLRIEATRDWVTFSNVFMAPLSLAGFSLERDGRRLDGSAWGRSVLNPGECLVIHKNNELPRRLPSECTLPISLPADKPEREYWLRGEVLVIVNPDTQYHYGSER